MQILLSLMLLTFFLSFNSVHVFPISTHLDMKYLAFGWTRRHRGCSAILLQKQLSILRWKVQWMTHNIKLQTKQQWRTVYHNLHCVKLLKLHLAIICDNFIPLAVENFFLIVMKGSFFSHYILCNYFNDPFFFILALKVSNHSCRNIWSNYHQSTTKKLEFQSS